MSLRVMAVCDHCASEIPGDTSACPGCGAEQGERGDIRRLPHEVVLGFVRHAEEFLAAGPVKQGVLAFAGGSFIAFGALLSVFLTMGIEQEGLSRLLLGVGFSAGFILVILSGSALFTEVNVILPELFLRRPSDLRLGWWRFWIIAYVGNAAGALFVGALVVAAAVLDGPSTERLAELIAEKLRYRDLGVSGWFSVLVSGILGNWLVGMAAFLASAARTISGKILGIIFPIVTFVAIGLQHAPANMGYFAIGLVQGNVGAGWGEAIWWNIVPASIGNLIGGGILVALLFWYTFGQSPEQRQTLRRVDDVAQVRAAGEAGPARGSGTARVQGRQP